MKHIIHIFLFSLLLTGCFKPQLPITTGVSQELAQYRKSVLSEINYDLSFRIPEQKDKKIDGTVGIRFNLKTVTQDLQLDFKGDTTVKYVVSYNGKASEIIIKNGHLVISRSNLNAGMNEIKLNFTCPDWSLNRNPEFLYTLFVPDRASTAFPCFDQPDLKAQFKLQLQIPQTWKAVANGSVEKEEISGFNKNAQFQTY